MAQAPVLVWIKKAMRLADNALWHEALAYDQPIIPLFIDDQNPEQSWPIGAASRWWLHYSLSAFDEQLRKKDSRLLLLQSKNPVNALLDLAKEVNASAILYDKRPEPYFREQESSLEQYANKGFDWLEVKGFWVNTLFEPEAVSTKTGDSYKVFTPYWRQALKQLDPEAKPLPEPKQLPLPKEWPKSGVNLKDFTLLPTIPWDSTMRETWTIGEQAAYSRLEQFLNNTVTVYDKKRDLPYESGTSRLSPHLHWGEISPRQILHAVYAQHKEKALIKETGPGTYLSEIGWREFAYQLLYHYPHTSDQPLYDKYNAFPWRKDAEALQRWQKGQTGYPIVDAGLRQLWATGWMHNRLRMVVGSFLVKDLLLPWQDGARWFWDTLVDADLASNSLGWQWAAGCGADAAPYFRIFNPVRQGERFDPDGSYVRQWVPELHEVSKKLIHNPWQGETLKKVTSANKLLLPGKKQEARYPTPIVNHAEAKERALKALEAIKA